MSARREKRLRKMEARVAYMDGRVRELERRLMTLEEVAAHPTMILSTEEKARPLSRAPSGMIGLETSLALTLTQLYHTKKLDLPGVFRRLSTNPADILHLARGRMSLGAVADLVIFDPDEEWTIDPDQFASKARNTPFAGMRVKGRVKYTIAGGKVIYQGG